jgi:hypothetical protein
VLVAAVAGAAAFALVRMQPAGETTAAAPTPTLTPTARVTPSAGTSPSASPTGYPAVLAQQTVQQYWDLISQGNVSQAYDLLSTGARQGTTRKQFVQSITRLLDVTNGLTAVAGTPIVQGSTATVPVALTFTNSGASHATQRLLWQIEGWRIDQAGAGISTRP